MSRRAIISGGSRGIGLAVARKFLVMLNKLVAEISVINVADHVVDLSRPSRSMTLP